MFKIHRKTPKLTNSTSVLAVEHALAELKRENNAKRETIYVVANGELVSVAELRRRDRRFTP